MFLCWRAVAAGSRRCPRSCCQAAARCARSLRTKTPSLLRTCAPPRATRRTRPGGPARANSGRRSRPCCWLTPTKHGLLAAAAALLSCVLLVAGARRAPASSLGAVSWQTATARSARGLTWSNGSGGCLAPQASALTARAGLAESRVARNTSRLHTRATQGRCMQVTHATALCSRHGRNHEPKDAGAAGRQRTLADARQHTHDTRQQHVLRALD
jgi:hypothetical protein